METKDKRPVLVTWDFTEKSAFALDHGTRLADILGTYVGLMHIVKKEKEIKEAESKMAPVVKETEGKANVTVKPMVMVGNIFTTISEVATDMNAEMVIMGTHGMKGMQKLIGSWALKVIAGSKVPFIVVQAPPTSHGFQKVVFPLDFRKENKEKINWMYHIHRLYNSKFYIMKDKVTDPKFKKGVTSNLHFTEKFLKANEIPYEIHTATSHGDFVPETIEFAHKLEADLVLITTTKDINRVDYILGANEQQIISNKYLIPVMCVQPKPAKLDSGMRAMGG